MKQILSWNEEYLDLRVAESLEEDGQPAKDRFRSYVKERAKALLDASDEEIEQMLENETDCLHYNDDTDEPAASILYNDYTEFLKMVDVPASYRIRAKYGSVWDGETTIESSCLIDLITREIIEVSVDDREIEGPYSEGEGGDAVECLDVQYVELPDGRIYPVITDEDPIEYIESDDGNEEIPFVLVH